MSGSVLGKTPDRLRHPILDCVAGGIPPTITAMRLLREATCEGEAERALEHAIRELGHEASRPLRKTLALLTEHPAAWSVVRAVSEGLRHDCFPVSTEEKLMCWQEVFDSVAKISPEASVALYSLGSPDLLRVATAEIATWLRGHGLTGRDRTVLDIGCGIGRIEEALAPEIGHVTGIDVSGEMISAARERCLAYRNVSFVQGSGTDVSFIPGSTIDLVVSIDAFPYLVQAGSALAGAHIAESARVLRPGGSLAVLNYSYRDDIELDRAEIAGFAATAGLEVIVNGVAPFEMWDARAFLLAKPGARRLHR
jgi:ubiquinone/menaquinone biosynthesis C-methylase UbiE